MNSPIGDTCTLCSPSPVYCCSFLPFLWQSNDVSTMHSPAVRGSTLLRRILLSEPDFELFAPHSPANSPAAPGCFWPLLDPESAAYSSEYLLIWQGPWVMLWRPFCCAIVPSSRPFISLSCLSSNWSFCMYVTCIARLLCYPGCLVTCALSAHGNALYCITFWFAQLLVLFTLSAAVLLPICSSSRCICHVFSHRVTRKLRRSFAICHLHTPAVSTGRWAAISSLVCLARRLQCYNAALVSYQVFQGRDVTDHVGKLGPYFHAL